jgi:hypothetical protein
MLQIYAITLTILPCLTQQQRAFHEEGFEQTNLQNVRQGWGRLNRSRFFKTGRAAAGGAGASLLLPMTARATSRAAARVLPADLAVTEGIPGRASAGVDTLTSLLPCRMYLTTCTVD